MTTTGSHRQCLRCDQESIETRSAHIFAVPCERASYRVSLTSETDVPTPDGWSTIGAIKPGQKLFDELGQVCTVTDVSEETQEIAHRLVFSDGSSITAGKGHPWMILTPIDYSPGCLNIRRSGPWNAGCWPMATHELDEYLNRPTEGRQTGSSHYIPVAGGLIPADRELPIDPWILGLWLGDGDSNSATIYTGPEDEPHYRERIGETGELWRVLNPGGTVLRCSLSRGPKPRLLTRLRDLNVFNNKHAPELYLRAGMEQRLALLQGLIDSDGHIYANGRAEFTSKSIRLAEGVQELALSLGMKATIRESGERGVERRVSRHYRVRFTPILPVATLPRKVDVATAFMERRPKDVLLRIARRRIDSVREAGMRTTRCISVDSPWGMVLVGRQMLPALVRRSETPKQS